LRGIDELLSLADRHSHRRSQPAGGPIATLRGALAILAIMLSAWQVVTHLFLQYPYAVDLEIPLRAAERFAAGGEPYLASAFSSPPGPTQPFLYPPYVLPPLVPLTALPRVVVQVPWTLLLLGAAVATCRRLGIGRWTPLVLAWPPFAEPLFGGNVQVLLFAAFVWLFHRPPTDGNSADRDLRSPRERPVWLGVLASSVAAIKVSQPHAWIYLLRERPVAAMIGFVLVAGFAVAMLPFTGIESWLDWLAQVRRAQDPTWELGGFAIANFAPTVGFVVAIAFVGLLAIVPRRDAGAWVGILATAGAFSLHIFGLLFLLPAMLRIRRELALTAAIFVATYSYEGSWAGIALVGLAFAAGTLRSGFYEPDRRATGDGQAGAVTGASAGAGLAGVPTASAPSSTTKPSG